MMMKKKKLEVNQNSKKVLEEEWEYFNSFEYKSFQRRCTSFLKWLIISW